MFQPAVGAEHDTVAVGEALELDFPFRLELQWIGLVQEGSQIGAGTDAVFAALGVGEAMGEHGPIEERRDVYHQVGRDHHEGRVVVEHGIDSSVHPMLEILVVALARRESSQDGCHELFARHRPTITK